MGTNSIQMFLSQGWLHGYVAKGRILQLPSAKISFKGKKHSNREWFIFLIKSSSSGVKSFFVKARLSWLEEDLVARSRRIQFINANSCPICYNKLWPLYKGHTLIQGGLNKACNDFSVSLKLFHEPNNSLSKTDSMAEIKSNKANMITSFCAELTCKGRCSEGFVRGRPCDCDPDCSLYGKCCPDFDQACLGGEYPKHYKMPGFRPSSCWGGKPGLGWDHFILHMAAQITWV